MHISEVVKIKNHIIPIVTLFAILFVFSFCISCHNKDEKNPEKIVLDSLIYKDDGKELFTGRMEGKVGNKKVEYDVVNGRKNGEFKLYNESGKLEIEGFIENNRNTGLWKYYYPDGQLESEGYFKNDLADSNWVWYYENGIVKERSVFKEGKRNGRSSRYDEKGNIISENIYKNDKILNEK